MYAELIYSTRESLIIAVVAGLGATILSVIVGVSAAYLGGFADDGLSMMTDIFLVLPTFPLIIVLATYAGKGNLTVIIVVLVLTGWAYGARQMRAQAMSCATGTSSSRPGSGVSGARTSSWSRCCRR